jgi:hypothetical protein
MKLLVRAALASLLSFSLLGCWDLNSSASKHEPIETNMEYRAKEDACKALLDYAQRYEEIFLTKEGPNRENQLSEITDEYHNRMSNLAQDSRWTPLQDMGHSVKLSFLIGQFHGALWSCHTEKRHNDNSSVGCDKVKELKKAMQELCQNQ